MKFFDLFIRSIVIKSVLFLALFGCEEHVFLYRSVQNSWCFSKFVKKKDFEDYVEFHKEYAFNYDNSESMRVLGCAYYQQGDLKEAQRWLRSAYINGDNDVATPLMLIYMKEGNFDSSKLWRDQIKEESVNKVSWSLIIDGLIRFYETDDLNDLEISYQELKNKMKTEGSTDLMRKLLTSIIFIREQDVQCTSVAFFNKCDHSARAENKAYVFTIAKGVLDSLLAINPISWSYNDDLKSISPSSREEEKQKAGSEEVESASAPLKSA